MNTRSVIGAVTMLAGIPGLWVMFFGPQGTHETSLPQWLYKVALVFSWIWIFTAFIGLSCMILGVRTKIFSTAAGASFAVFFGLAFIDVAIQNSWGSSDSSLWEFLAAGAIFLGWTGANLYDHGLVDQLNKQKAA